jgi:hypothetical protein
MFVSFEQNFLYFKSCFNLCRVFFIMKINLEWKNLKNREMFSNSYLKNREMFSNSYFSNVKNYIYSKFIWLLLIKLFSTYFLYYRTRKWLVLDIQKWKKDNFMLYN